MDTALYARLYGTLRRTLWPGGRRIARSWRELQRSQWLRGDELQALQLQRLQRLVACACRHVPYYRSRFAREGIHPEDLRTWADLRALPLLGREDITACPEDMVDPAYAPHVRRRYTSGTTGTPMGFFQDPGTWYWSAAVEARSRGWYGVRAGDRIAWFWSNQRDMPDRSWTWREHLAARTKRYRYLNVFGLTEARMRAFATMLTRWQPRLFRSNPAVLAYFTRFLQEEGLTGIRPRLIESTGQALSEPERRLFEDFYQCAVADNYSNLELHHIAYQCPQGGLHVVEDRIVEVLDDDGPAPPGCVGNITVTALNEVGVPFIRYQTGDLGILRPEACPCGRGMPMLATVVGRTRDVTVTADGAYVYGAYFAQLFAHAPDVVRYQVYQPDRLALEVRLQCRRPPSTSWLEALRLRLQAQFGESMRISLLTVDSIAPGPSGKLRFIISEVEPGAIAAHHRAPGAPREP